VAVEVAGPAARSRLRFKRSIREPQQTAAELGPKDPILLSQVVDDPGLCPVHESCEQDQQEAPW